MKAKTILAMVITMVVMTGLTGLGSAGDVNVMGGTSGYAMEYDGVGGGIVNINTYMDGCSDHKTISYNDAMYGYQSAVYESTIINRYDTVDNGGFLASLSRSNTDALVSTYIEATNDLSMVQDLELMNANGSMVSDILSGATGEYVIDMMASNDNINNATKLTSVMLVGDGQAEMGVITASAADNNAIVFNVDELEHAYDIPTFDGTSGNGSLFVRTYSDEFLGLEVNGPSTFTVTIQPGEMVYVTTFINVEAFNATGYVYATMNAPTQP